MTSWDDKVREDTQKLEVGELPDFLSPDRLDEPGKHRLNLYIEIHRYLTEDRKIELTEKHENKIQLACH